MKGSRRSLSRQEILGLLAQTPLRIEAVTAGIEPSQLHEEPVDQREQLLGELEQIPSAAWSRSAAVIGAGRVLERTVHFYAEWLATHERSHLRQFQHLATELRRR